MAYLASELVSRSWNLSGIVGRGLQQVQGDQATEGLFLLNTLLDFKASDLRLIPYWKRDTFDMVIGQEMYFIPDLYAVETMTYTQFNIQYSMTPASRDEYFNDTPVTDLISMPYKYLVDREEGGSNVYIYFLPNYAYTVNYSGKFALTNVTMFQDMSLTYDGFYMEYLRFALAEMMCMEYDITFSADKKAMLSKYEKKLRDISTPDLTLKRVNFINRRGGANWAQINLGQGYQP